MKSNSKRSLPATKSRKSPPQSTYVSIVEVGPRDGLQNESTFLDMTTRLEFASRLAQAGLKRVELGAFVSPTWVPQMAGTGLLFESALKLQKKKKINPRTLFSALVPNEKGMQDAIDNEVKEVAVFAAASETFSQRNTNCSIKESFQRFEPVMKMAQQHKMRVRGYLSTCFGCPYEGKISESKVLKVSEKMLKMGVYELSIGDTIGIAHPRQARSLVRKLVEEFGSDILALHYHDTRGLALANILVSLEEGVRTFDSSLGGLGGCPYAPGASGNVATEDVVYLLHNMGFKTGVDLNALIKINKWISHKVGHALPAKISQTL